MDTKELKQNYKELIGKEVIIQGWIRNHRRQKDFGFIDFHDGTSYGTIQVVYDNKLKNFAYEDAVKMVDLRYPKAHLSCLLDGKEWYSRKEEIENFLEKYNDEALKKNNCQTVLDHVITKSVAKRQRQKAELLNLEKTRFSKNECCCVF